MDLKQITPLILTFNESPNIGRCLEHLAWAKRIVVIDSGSTDETLEICESHSNVEVIHRSFDSFAPQCNFGLQQIRSEWVLSIDADYIVPIEFPERISKLPENVDGYRSGFRYCIYGRPLRATLYPPRVSLYRRTKAYYLNIGHGHRVSIDGRVEAAPFLVSHDDRKSLDRWLNSQQKYAKQEAIHLATADQSKLNVADRIRLSIWPAVPAVLFYTLVWKMCLLDGWAGWFYALQRTYAELLLSIELLDHRLRPK